MSSKPRSPDLKQIDMIYKAMADMQVHLDPNPLEFAPSRINEKIAEARTYRSDCQNMLETLLYQLNLHKRYLRHKTTEFKMKRLDLMKNSLVVKSGSSASDREALVEFELKDLVLEIQGIEKDVAELESVITLVKGKKGDLSDIQNRIKDQMKMCHDEILYLGAKWSKRKAPDKEEEKSRKEENSQYDEAASEIDEILEDVLGGDLSLEEDKTQPKEEPIEDLFAD